ncbi:hypothetical protein [Falsirhodobacter sp. 20TX0035]|uniref:hypothetical protein n=1 Tax=Falsirhodobacter sp. 20TX0035 TaxID=3022019 RepID=UPI00232ABAB2|nr:hypothetical protein [Falsirhodobacter sp. 20TX0035]MDB6454403.1 hypothetical protein [Falsirhodobacter sp. 20TX0035]
MTAIHPSRLRLLFDPPLPDAVAARLRAEPRFADRIAAMAGPDPLDGADPADRALLAMGREGLETLALRAGVVLHARALLREIRGPVIAALAARFGEGALTDARRHLDLSPDRTDLAEPERIAADGTACLSAWLDTLPPALRDHAALAWPDNLPPGDEVTRTHGPAILRRLAEA